MPDAPVPTLGEKTYEVVGRNAVFGGKTGEVLKLDLTEEQEQFYINGGHLKVTTKKVKEVTADG